MDFGVNQSLLRYPNSAALPLIAGTGAVWVRVDVPWFSSGTWTGVEGPTGRFHPVAAKAVNALAAGCAGFGMNLLCPLTVGAGGGTFGANSVARFAKMAAWIAGECPGLHWEILNEPDLREATDPAVYTALAKAAYAAMKTADPTCTVIAGAIAVPQTTTFMAACYTAGIKGSYDALSIHTYDQLPAYGPDYDPGHHLAFNVGQQQKLMAANADAAPLWITEFGWDSKATDRQGDFITMWLAELATLNVPVAMLYNLLDGAQPPYWGLVDAKLAPKAAYRAARAFDG